MELASRKKRARKALEDSIGGKVHGEPPLKKIKVSSDGFWREQKGLLPLVPECGVCTDSLVVETADNGWVCSGCGRCLALHAPIDDAPPTFEERQQLNSSSSSGTGTSATVLATWIEGSERLAAAASRVDKCDRKLEDRLKTTLSLVDDLLRHLKLHLINSTKLAVRARQLVRGYVVEAKHGLDNVLTVTWCKVAYVCVLRAAAENMHGFLPSECKAALHAVADTHAHRSGTVERKGVRCNDSKTVSVIRAQLEQDLKLAPLAWAMRARGFTARFADVLDAKQRTNAFLLIDWFAAQPDSADLNAKSKEKGQVGCRAKDAIRSTAIALLQCIDADISMPAATTSAIHGATAENFAFLAVWLVCASLHEAEHLERAEFGRLKRVFAAYAKEFLCKR